MKIFVGIDIAKLNHFAATISSDGEILIEPFKFTNDADGFQLLVSPNFFYYITRLTNISFIFSISYKKEPSIIMLSPLILNQGQHLSVQQSQQSLLVTI